MTDFKKINNLVGWGTFVVSLLVYILTIEQTASFWDCGEFIAIAYKLEVSHPPGAPLFMLIGRLFSFLSFGNPEQVAFWINMSSAIASSFTILFLYWSIVMLGRKLIDAKIWEETPLQRILLMGAGIVGALTFTFTDSFWFSAVEGEVYAMSSFFTAIVFWAILKWELVEDESEANKWLVLIAYLIGLSAGVHLLGLVTLPAMGVLYYFKKYKKPSFKGLLIATLFSVILIGVINSFVITGLPSLAERFEVTFVNTFGLPFGSGALFLALILISALVFGLRYTAKNSHVGLNTLILGFTFVLVGYTCYGIILVRSKANPPIDQNNPENVMTFSSYLKREQYGSRPLFKGPYFNAPQPTFGDGAPIYYKAEDEYKIADYKQELTYDSDWQTILPRMWSTQDSHKQAYMRITGLREGEKPSMGDNLFYMFQHQIGKMYLRYFLFNFAGRESDIQDADWLRPFEGNADLPQVLKENKGRNQYYMIPLILGLVGFFFQFNKDPKRFLATLMFFVLTGLALVIYLNSVPIEPRERDYIYVGSYYVFAMWIGMSVLAIGNLLKNKGKAAYAGIALGLISPIILASQNWDDHDRSDRYFSVDSARNFLASCAPNAILFTGGDNDTFPLWYVQEVEGFRTDVRVVVLSYYNTDWYIDQTQMKVNESEPFPYSLTTDNYRTGTNDFLYIAEQPQYKGKGHDLKGFMNRIKRDDPTIKARLGSGNPIMVVPTKTLSLRVDVEQVLNTDLVPDKLKPFITDQMDFTFNEGSRFLEKSQMMLLDLIAHNNWERPIYFNYTSLNSMNWNVEDYIVQEGMTYRLLPVRKPRGLRDLVNTDLMYDNMKNKFQFRGMDNPKANLNEDYRGFAQNHRSSFTTLADALMLEGDSTRAKDILDYGMEVLPRESIPYDVSSVGFVQAYLDLDEKDKAIEMGTQMGTEFYEMLVYHLEKERYDINFQKYLSGLRYLQAVFTQAGLKPQADDLDQKLNDVNFRLTNPRNF